MSSEQKARVADFWDIAACGEQLLLPSRDRAGFRFQEGERYRLEPYIEGFADFGAWQGARVLEIGVGLGADHQRFVECGAGIVGVDLTSRAIEFTRQRLALFGLDATLMVGDAEKLPLHDDTFDLVYSWGVIHHTPETQRAVQEIHRVLRPGGQARIMIYSKWSLVGLMLWVRYALLRLRPFTSMREIYARYLESPGTKAYTSAEARALFRDFSEVTITTMLSHADLLSSSAGQRHTGSLLTLARRVWPRSFIRRYLPGWGLFMLITARKARE